MGQITSNPAAAGPRFIAVPGPLPPGEPKPWPTYDYIIIGGGTAGCVLAGRLSEDPRTKVLLIEAGNDFRDALPTKIPFSFSNIFGTALDWKTYTVPQRGLNGRQAFWARGKVLGGTSSTNALIYHRCSPSDFDEWAATGAEGWSYNDLIPYFLKAEKYRPSSGNPRVNPAHHGQYGPRSTGFPSETAPINGYVMESCRELGLRNIDDINAGQGSLGVTKLPGTIDSDGRRSSTATAYLTDKVLSRPNLIVATDIMIQKLVFSDIVPPGQPPRVIGVQMNTAQDPQIYCCGANKEVILCAGTVGTPQLLMLSGVGPAEDLKRLGIPVVQHMPAVGRNVVDHVMSGPIPFRTKPDLTYDFLKDSCARSAALLKWKLFGTGPLASMDFSSTAFVRSTDPRLPFYTNGRSGPPVNDRSSGPGAPDLELVWAPQATFTDSFQSTNVNANIAGVTFGAVALRPESRGSITLRSTDAFEQPNIDPQYLSSENDMNVLVRGVRLVLRLAHTDPVASKLDLKPRGINASSPWWPGVADPSQISDEEIREMLRRTALPAWHPVSSARMGRSPADSVVDPTLRVHGIIGLRCVDASVFPTQVSGHPCAVVNAIAEKAADMIKASAAVARM